MLHKNIIEILATISINMEQITSLLEYNKKLITKATQDSPEFEKYIKIKKGFRYSIIHEPDGNTVLTIYEDGNSASIELLTDDLRPFCESLMEYPQISPDQNEKASFIEPNDIIDFND